MKAGILPEGTATALAELLWSLLWVNVFVAVAGVLVGRRLESITLGVAAYVGTGLVASGVVLSVFGANVLVASVLEWRDRRTRR